MVDGLEELQRNLVKLQLNNKKAAKRGVILASNVVKKNLEANTPYDSDSKTGEHLREDVQVTAVTGMGRGTVSSDIGFGRKTGRRFHYPEFGTTKQEPLGFAQKTIEQSKAEVLAIYANEVRKGNQL
ncbi:HK97-gp10 family putative phage morphogenesis protein [Paenilisteria newyorkensis]|uniref:HK97-gp10 family putative phage morphogenesis protein n=1 Tax=Listeria newyorkensis TaxID=1497681 RepID=UPI000669F5C6|nr:HK97-gp10 family putative phage morphogenesis protein [Listeria newyorkensis]KMT58901.1 hypothetical protein X559_2907 [Listeria newyorkensis]